MQSSMTRTLFGLCLVFLVVAPAQADLIVLHADLDGAQEEPQVGQAAVGGSGVADMTFDTVTHVLSWTIFYSLNTGPASAAHFHGPTADGDPAGFGIASLVRFAIPGIAGTSSGTVMGSFDLDTLMNPANNPAKLLADLWYINIHTGPGTPPAKFPSGEIRGQVQVVPEPATFGLMAIGLTILGIARRRRS